MQDEAALEELAMGSLLSVARGSGEPACLIELEYRGAPESEAPTVLVGKGVTFDSGGISIKPSAAMDEMKFDMCGAASTFGAVEAAATLGLPINLIGLVPATENLPGGRATKPGDIVTSMSGQTIEILNTDAEGRLILCDAITFASRFKPEVVIDIATSPAPASSRSARTRAGSSATTGRSPRAWWKRESTPGTVPGRCRSGRSTGRRWKATLPMSRMWEVARRARLPPRLSLHVSPNPFGGAHLDIAGTAWRGGKQKGATGRPVRLLVQYLLDRTAETPEEAEA